MKALASPLGRKRAGKGMGAPEHSLSAAIRVLLVPARLRTRGLSNYLCFLRRGREGGKGVGQIQKDEG